jgi:hypothetical protein
VFLQLVSLGELLVLLLEVDGVGDCVIGEEGSACCLGEPADSKLVLLVTDELRGRLGDAAGLSGSAFPRLERRGELAAEDSLDAFVGDMVDGSMQDSGWDVRRNETSCTVAWAGEVRCCNLSEGGV